MKKIIYLAIILLVVISCKTQEIYLNVIEPAPVTLPAGANRVGIADRSDVPKEAKAIDVLDKVLTLEGAELDRTGAEACLSGLTEALKENNRFEKIERIDEKFPALNLIGAFPPPLSWEEAGQICDRYGFDLLFSLEAFDTDTRINYNIIKGGGQKTILGALAGVEHRADMQTIVKTSWRIYYPAGRTILDEFPLIHSLNFSASGLTPVVAAAALIDRKEAVKKTGIRAAHIYASRIIPSEITVKREYYVKGTDNFKIARRKARTGNWDEAGELWKAETNNPEPKIASRACFNMAVFAEIKGSPGVAAEWARKAYEDYNLRRSLKYLHIIENRMRKNELVEYQQQN